MQIATTLNSKNYPKFIAIFTYILNIVHKPLTYIFYGWLLEQGKTVSHIKYNIWFRKSYCYSSRNERPQHFYCGSNYYIFSRNIIAAKNSNTFFSRFVSIFIHKRTLNLHGLLYPIKVERHLVEVIRMRA